MKTKTLERKRKPQNTAVGFCKVMICFALGLWHEKQKNFQDGTGKKKKA